jgi:hypothetical protein
MSEYFVTTKVSGQSHKMRIDLNQGLGRFLVNHKVLSNRVLFHRDTLPVFDSECIYKRYKFDKSQFRFEPDLEFRGSDIELVEIRSLEFSSTRTGLLVGERLIDLQDLGCYEEFDLNSILVKTFNPKR